MTQFDADLPGQFGKREDEGRPNMHNWDGETLTEQRRDPKLDVPTLADPPTTRRLWLIVAAVLAGVAATSLLGWYFVKRRKTG